MALWDKITSRGRVEDRRGAGTMLALGGGGLSVAGIVVYLAITLLSGGGIGDVLTQLPTTTLQQEQQGSASVLGKADNYQAFAEAVLGSANDMWAEVFAGQDLQYTQPTLILFRGATPSSCGIATSEVGPHYCPLDSAIYLDETFFEELQRRFNAKGGDVAQGYVIAHEVGHHVQNLLGIMSRVQREQELRPSEAGDLSIKLELQADCFAGLWGYTVQELGVLEQGEIAEALDAAAVVGDDRIQQTIEGRVVPENWTHGSSEQRVEWFTNGFETGEVNNCDTFR